MKKIDIQEYTEINPHLFHEFQELMKENFTCLEKGLNTASITLSNHILEKLLKVSIIYKLGLGLSDAEFSRINLEYDGTNLYNNIEKLRSLELINEAEENVLKEYIREVIRNGFSHAESEKILKDVNPIIPAMNFKGEPVEMSRHRYRFISQLQIQSLVEKFAPIYYRYIFILMHELEDRISPDTIHMRNKTKK